jgi:hypothetical protein
MIIGDPTRFAIESGITNAYERAGILALGFFVLHIGGRRYGVYSPVATTLACAVESVKRRITDRGKHTTPFTSEPDAGKIADAVRLAVYAPDQEKESYFGIPQPEFIKLFYTRSTDRLWGPDCDEAFDDGSQVIQFDVNDHVRLIAFKSIADGYHHDPHSLCDVWLSADNYYSILQQWLNDFEREWKAAPKVAE